MEDLITFLNSSIMGALIFQNERIVFANPAAAELTGYSVSELTNFTSIDFVNLFQPQDQAPLLACLTKSINPDPIFNFRIVTRSKIWRYTRLHEQDVIFHNKPATFLELVDVTKQVQFEIRQDLTARIVGTLNLPNMPIRARLTELLSHIRQALAIESVGIRMRTDESLSLFGFAEPLSLFIGPYRMNCEPSNEGKNCVCGAILRSENPNLSCFTARGSFITNNYASDIDQIEGLAPLLTRFRCSRDGFNSIASIPICAEGKNLGILHLASPQPGCFPQDTIPFLESLGEFVGLALLRQKIMDEGHELREVVQSYHPLKYEFLATMSHEIRSPMNAILGFTELLMEAPLEGKYHEYLTIVKSRGRDLLQVIDNFLGLARLEAKQVPVLNESFSLRDCIASVVACIQPSANEKGLALVTVIDDELPEFVYGDSQRIDQVLTKLLSCSVKLTASGEIRLTVKKEASMLQGRTRIGFGIRDTGMGLAPLDQAEPYQARSLGGLNLDLLIVRHLIKEMNGEFSIDSKVGHGSNCQLRLDLTLPPSPRTPKQLDTLIASPPSMTILLADDDITSRILFGAVLRRDGHTIVEAMDGGMALAAASNMDFDLVLMDIQMPVMDGISATKAIRSMKSQNDPILHRRSNVPIVALTAHTLHEDEEACLKAGMNGYLKKPLQADSLRACLQTYYKKKP